MIKNFKYYLKKNKNTPKLIKFEAWLTPLITLYSFFFNTKENKYDLHMHLMTQHVHKLTFSDSYFY